MCYLLSASDLDSIRALFNEKEKELCMAVAKVEELTRQLEEVKRGRASGPHNANNAPSVAALELEKLRRELMVSAYVLFHSLFRFACKFKTRFDLGQRKRKETLCRLLARKKLVKVVLQLGNCLKTNLTGQRYNFKNIRPALEVCQSSVCFRQ